MEAFGMALIFGFCGLTLVIWHWIDKKTEIEHAKLTREREKDSLSKETK